MKGSMKSGTPLLKGIVRLEKFSDRAWYNPLIGVLAGLDHFIIVVPTDGLIVSSALLQPKRWLSLTLFASAGSTLGAFAMAALVRAQGEPFVRWIVGDPARSPGWQQAAHWLQFYGSPALIAMAMLPLPLQPAIAVCALAGLPLETIALWVFIGRLGKYGLYAWGATRGAKWIRKWKKARSESDAINATAQEMAAGLGSVDCTKVQVQPQSKGESGNEE